MTPNRALEIIQDMADHSQRWHDESTIDDMDGFSETNSLTKKLENLGKKS